MEQAFKDVIAERFVELYTSDPFAAANYLMEAGITTPEQAKELAAAVKAAFERRGYKV